MPNNFQHHGSMGDIIYSLPTVISCGGNAVLYIKPDHMKILYSLLKAQPYIHDVKNKNEIENPFTNLDTYRAIARLKRSQHLVLSHLEAHQKQCTINWQNEPWLYSIEPKYVADIIINRTKRYHDREEINWHILEPYKEKCKFVGYEQEWKQFVRRYKMDIQFCPTIDALELAQVIKGSKLFIGNQSLAFAIAEAIKHTRSLEVYYNLNNCQPHGPNGYTYLSNELIIK